MTRGKEEALKQKWGGQVEKLKEQIEELKQGREQAEKERDQVEKERDQVEKERDRLKEQVAELEEELEELEEELEACRRAGYRQAAPFRREKGRKIEKSKQKRPGRPRGHCGHYRKIPDYIDEHVEAPLKECPHCQGGLSDLRPQTQYIEEIPRLRPRVIEVTTYRGTCKQCGRVASVHPLQSSRAQGAAQVQLGTRALALATELNKRHGLSMRKTCRVLHQITGLTLSPGGLSQALDRVADRLSTLRRKDLEEIRKAPAVFADETSWWVGEPGWWLWVFTTPETTLYVVEPSRGSEVVENTLGEDFSGTLVSDCLASYDPPSYAKHKCISHHLKAIAQARDRPDTKDPAYLNEWSLFFKTVIALHSLALEKPSSAPESTSALQQWQNRLLAQAPRQPGDIAIRNRLKKQRHHLLGCMRNTAAEPTNNRAERALRPAVIARKLSCGNRTLRGKRTWEILASHVVTHQQRDLDFVETLTRELSIGR